jgi:hypothetical protein
VQIQLSKVDFVIRDYRREERSWYMFVRDVVSVKLRGSSPLSQLAPIQPACGHALSTTSISIIYETTWSVLSRMYSYI